MADTNGSSRLLPPEQKVVVAALEKYTNGLAIYHGTSKKPLDNDIFMDSSFSDTDSDMNGIIEELKKKIRDRITFETSTKEIEGNTMRKKAEEALLSKAAEYERITAKLRQTIVDEKNTDEEERKCLLSEISVAQREAERQKFISELELNYVTAWEEARREQNSLRCNMEMEKLKKILNDYRIHEKNEKRVHAALMTFYDQDIATTEEKIKEWQDRYDREKEMYKKEIRKIRNEIETRRKALEELKKEYRANQEFIDKYLAEKEALKKQKEEEEHMRRSAIRIQAWWRGVMVRRKLGPYRPQEKKKKRPAKTKK